MSIIKVKPSFEHVKWPEIHSKLPMLNVVTSIKQSNVLYENYQKKNNLLILNIISNSCDRIIMHHKSLRLYHCITCF